ncbi:hypothetical protein DFS34DRAFT_193740 [Phlyctochytrium arcticum]|nr:hypothetical protein DFS34DRAFT_193740 [Phlyctochytrium arcticum]
MSVQSRLQFFANLNGNSAGSNENSPNGSRSGSPGGRLQPGSNARAMSRSLDTLSPTVNNNKGKQDQQEQNSKQSENAQRGAGSSSSSYHATAGQAEADSAGTATASGKFLSVRERIARYGSSSSVASSSNSALSQPSPGNERVPAGNLTPLSGIKSRLHSASVDSLVGPAESSGRRRMSGARNHPYNKGHDGHATEKPVSRPVSRHTSDMDIVQTEAAPPREQQSNVAVAGDRAESVGGGDEADPMAIVVDSRSASPEPMQMTAQTAAAAPAIEFQQSETESQDSLNDNQDPEQQASTTTKQQQPASSASLRAPATVAGSSLSAAVSLPATPAATPSIDTTTLHTAADNMTVGQASGAAPAKTLAQRLAAYQSASAGSASPQYETPSSPATPASAINTTDGPAAAVKKAQTPTAVPPSTAAYTANSPSVSSPAAAASPGKFGTTATPKCAGCNKAVYLMEQTVIDNTVFHKTCLKCTHCKNTLKMGNLASMNGQYYCKPHFKQLFKLKGNYAEGFGLEDHKKQWLADKPAQ